MSPMLSRPTIKTFKKPLHISEYPTGPCFEAGHLVKENAGWRIERPVVRSEYCIGCYYCYLCCPEGVIFKSEDEGKIEIDYAFCKGCGICARVCKRGAIEMIKEAGI